MREDLWNRNQLILALNLYWKTPYNKISGSSNEEIKKLAKVIGKTPAAIAYMLMNFTFLDKERQDKGEKGKRGPGKLGVEIWFEYLNQWAKLATDSSKILYSIEPNLVSDFFEIEPDYKYTEGVDKLRLVKTRVNQSDFRQRVLASYNRRCCITGLDIPSLLTASHIVPWSKNVKERLNPQNGLCLNSIHDKAFDKGLITITTDFKVKLSDIILHKKKDLNIQKFFILYENQSIVLPDRYIPSVEFLEYHHENIFNKIEINDKH